MRPKDTAGRLHAFAVQTLATRARTPNTSIRVETWKRTYTRTMVTAAFKAFALSYLVVFFARSSHAAQVGGSDDDGRQVRSHRMHDSFLVPGDRILRVHHPVAKLSAVVFVFV